MFNTKTKHEKHLFNGPASKRPRVEDEDDEDDDDLFRGAAMEEIELFATQAENEGNFEQTNGDNGKSSSELKLQLEELTEMNKQKCGESLLLRERLAELERQLANEREEKWRLEKENQKREEKFRQDISKCKEKYEDRLGFSRKELDEAKITIKALSKKSKQQETFSSPSTSSKIKVVKVTTPRSPQNDLLKITDRKPDDLRKNVKSRNKNLNKRRLMRQERQVADRYEVFKHFCEHLETRLHGNEEEDDNKELKQITMDARITSAGLLLAVNDQHLFNDDYRLNVCLPFFKFFPVYVEKCCDLSAPDTCTESKNIAVILEQFEQMLESSPKLQEHILQNCPEVLESLYNLCRHPLLEEKALQTVYQVYNNSPGRYRHLLIPLFRGRSTYLLTHHMIKTSTLILDDREASKQFLCYPTSNESILSTTSDENHRPDVNFLLQLQETYIRSKTTKNLSEFEREQIRQATLHFITLLTWEHTELFVEFPQLLVTLQGFQNIILSDELKQVDMTEHQLTCLLNMIHNSMPMFNSQLPRISCIDPLFLIDIKDRLFKLDDADFFIRKTREMLKELLDLVSNE